MTLSELLDDMWKDDNTGENSVLILFPLWFDEEGSLDDPAKLFDVAQAALFHARQQRCEGSEHFAFLAGLIGSIINDPRLIREAWVDYSCLKGRDAAPVACFLAWGHQYPPFVQVLDPMSSCPECGGTISHLPNCKAAGRTNPRLEKE